MVVNALHFFICRFQWFSGPDELSSDNKKGISVLTVDQFTSSLSFPNLKTFNSGNYTCVASNAAAKAVHSAQLVVNSKSEHLVVYVNVLVNLTGLEVYNVRKLCTSQNLYWVT